MKYLTPIYLTLMHGFKVHADYVLSRVHPELNYISILQEYCTLRMDGGRQSGKTKAVAEFAIEWIKDGGTVTVLSTKQAYARLTVEAIKKMNVGIDALDYKTLNDNLVVTSVRDYLSEDCCKYRGMTFGRQLIIIDEVIRCPEMYKFYAAYAERYHLSSLQKTHGKIGHPLFFVIGMQ